jgi:hypothetical protein
MDEQQAPRHTMARDRFGHEAVAQHDRSWHWPSIAPGAKQSPGWTIEPLAWRDEQKGCRINEREGSRPRQQVPQVKREV